MNAHFMVDIETTGLRADQEDILEVAFLKVEYDPDAGLWKPGPSYVKFLHSDRDPKPNDKFAQEHMKEMYAYCKTRPHHSIAEIRDEIRGFTAQDKIQIMGKNVANFDQRWLLTHGILLEQDLFYRFYEITGAINMAMDALGYTQTKEGRDAFLKAAADAGAGSFQMPAWEMMNIMNRNNGVPLHKPHEGLYDCYQQLQELNGMILMVRKGAYGNAIPRGNQPGTQENSSNAQGAAGSGAVVPGAAGS